jgi:hypothetical protein
MAVLRQLRETLAADLAEAGVTVTITAAWPAPDLQVPCMFVAPPLSGSYVTPGPNFGSGFTVRVDVVMLVEHASAEASLAALEELIEAALINTADWALEGVDAPAPTAVTDGGGEYLAAVLHLSKSVTIN